MTKKGKDTKVQSLFESVAKVREYWVNVLHLVATGGGQTYTELQTIDIFDFLQLLNIRKKSLKK